MGVVYQGLVFCSIECLRHEYGVLANPERMLMHWEEEHECRGCGFNMAAIGGVADE
jgi:hypothetical protein